MDKSASALSFEVDGEKGIPENELLKTDDISYKTALVHLIQVSIPSCFALFFQVLLEVINITFVGNLNDSKAMATVGLASLTINAFMFGPGYGICGGIDTLVASAFGNNEHYLCGVYFNRGRLIQTWIVFPIAIILLYFATDIFMLMGQDKEVAEMTHRFLHVALPGALWGLQFQITKRFMLAQKIFNTIVCFQVVLLVEHLAISYYIIYSLDKGYMGAAYAHAITNLVAALGMNLVIKYIPGIVDPESLHFFNKDSFTGWMEYLRYGFPSAVTTTLQWASFEMMGIYAGILGVSQLGAHTALANMHSFFHMIPLGMSFGAGACVGNCLGKGEHNIARKYAFMSYLLATCNACLEIIFLILCSEKIFRLYTQNEELLGYMRATLYSIYFTELNSNLLGILKGLIKAMGRQPELARNSILVNAILANIFCLVFWFYFGYGLPGIWFGLACALSVGNLVFTYKVFMADWKEETMKAVQRVMKDKKGLLN